MHSAGKGPTPPCEACESANTRRAFSQFAVRGASSSDPAEMAAQSAADSKPASITPREQINKWRREAKH